MSVLQTVIDYYKSFFKGLGYSVQTRSIRHLFEPNVGEQEQRLYLGNDIWVLTSDRLSLPPDTEIFISSDLEHLISTVGEFNCMEGCRHIVLKGEVNIGIYPREDEEVRLFLDFLVLSPVRKVELKSSGSGCCCGCD